MSNAPEQPVCNGFACTNTPKRNVNGKKFQSNTKYFNLASEMPAELGCCVSRGAPHLTVWMDIKGLLQHCPWLCLLSPTPRRDTGTAQLHPAAQAAGISLWTRHLCSSPAILSPLLLEPWPGRYQQSLSDSRDNHKQEQRVNIHGAVWVQLGTPRIPPRAAGPADCVFRCTTPRLSDLPDKDISNERGNWLYVQSVSVSPSVTWG